MSEAYQRRRDNASGFADFFQMLTSWIADRGIDNVLAKRLKDLEPVVDRRLTSDDLGALLYVKIYRGPEGEKLLNGVDFLATGVNPNAAWKTSQKTGGISASAPGNMLFDRENSYMIWYRKRSVKVGPAHLSGATIPWPDYALVMNGTYPTR